jgi:hypothetical protein
MFKSSTMGKKMSISEMDELFHNVLLEVQRRYPKLLPDLVKITDKFSTFRLLRRGRPWKLRRSRYQEKSLKQTIDGGNSVEQKG